MWCRGVRPGVVAASGVMQASVQGPPSGLYPEMLLMPRGTWFYLLISEAYVLCMQEPSFLPVALHSSCEQPPTTVRCGSKI